jgi:hypothetical protein
VAQQKYYMRDPVTKKTVIHYDGLERLKASGVDVNNLPVLTDQEMKVYKLMRDKFDEFYLRANAANVAAGHKPFPKVENYFTFHHDFGRLLDEGHDLTRGEGMQKFLDYIHPTKVPFKYEKYRGKEALPLELSAFAAMEAYIPRVLRHVYLSPRISKMREIIGPYKDIAGEEYRLSQAKPYAYRFMDEWLTRVSGVKTGQAVLHPTIDRALRTLNKNIAASLLAGTIRTVLIQPTQLVASWTELGTKHLLHGVFDVLNSTVDPRLWKEAMDKSKVLQGRTFDASAQELLSAVRARRFGRAKESLTKMLLKPMQGTDLISATATWRGAYRQALSKGLDEVKAIRFADDIVVRTQASGAVHDVSRIQSTSLGRLVTALQTFVINDWNFFTRDVLGVGNPRLVSTERFVKLLKYMIGKTLVNVIYEDVIGMDSPFGRPIDTAIELIREGKSGSQVVAGVGGELLEGLPMLGGAIRYGGESLLGPAISTGIRLVDSVSRGDLPSLAETAEFAGKAAGVPMTGQVSKTARRLKQGQPPWAALAGKSAPPPPSRGTRTSRKGRSGRTTTRKGR